MFNNTEELNAIIAADKLCTQRRELIGKINALKEEILRLNNISMNSLIKNYKSRDSWWIITVFWLIGVIIVSFTILTYVNRGYPYVLAVVIISVVCYILLALVRQHRIKKKSALDYQNNQHILQQKNTEYSKLVNQVKELESFMRERNNCIIPERYWNQSRNLLDYIANLRANTLTEAINLLESENQSLALLHDIRSRLDNLTASVNDLNCQLRRQ